MTTYSKRGLQVLKHLGADGDSIDQAADKMAVTRSTVEKHLQRIKKQLSARSLINAIYIATKSGLIMVVIVVSAHDGGVDFERRRVSQRRREQYDFLHIPTMGLV